MKKRAIENRINEKIQDIRKYLDELNSVLSVTLEEYLRDFKIRNIYERQFEKIIEAIIDMIFLIIRKEGFKIPDNEDNSFEILSKEKVISKVLTKKLKSAKGMRNIIVHEYGKIDDVLVYMAVTEELEKDVEEFIKTIDNYLKKEKMRDENEK